MLLASLFQSIAYVFEAFASENGINLTANLIGIFADAFMGVTEIASKLIEDILNIFITPFVENRDAFRTALEGFLGTLSTVAETIKQSIDDTFKNLNAVYDAHFKPFFDSIATGLSTLVGQFMSFWNGTVQPILDGWAEKFDVLWSEHIQPMINNFIELFGKAADFLNAFWNETLMPFISWIIENILPPVTTVVNGIVTVFMNMVGKVSDTINKILGALGGFVDWLTAHQGIVKDFIIIIGSFVAAWGVVNLAITIGEIVTALVSFVTAGGLAAAVLGVLSTALGVLGGVIAFLTSPITIAIAAIGGLIAAGILLYEHWDFVKQKAGELKDWIVEKFNELLTWFSGLPAKFSEFGTNIINGLKSGITGAWESLTSTIGEVASSVIEKFKNILGIHSPSTVMEENGAYMVEGLENGIASSIDRVYALFNPDTWLEIGREMFLALMDAVEEFKLLWIESFTLWQEENLELFFGYDLWYEQWYQFMQAYLDVNELFMAEWFTNIENWWKTMVTPYFEIAKWKTFGDNMRTGIMTGFKTIVNEIAGVLNHVITLFNSGYKQLQDAMNALIDDYNAKAAIMGTATLGHVNYSAMAMLKVPALASGAVIRGGNPFLAILGDQPRGQTNIETPANLIKDMARQGIREELSGLNLSGGNANQIISLNVDGQEFARLTLGGFLEEMNRQGYNVEILGVT